MREWLWHRYQPIVDDSFCKYDEVDERDRSGNTFIKDGFIAEVSLAKSRGDVIRSFLKHEKTLLKINRLRAKIKRHRGDAPAQPGSTATRKGFHYVPRDEKLIEKCLEKLERLERSLKGLSKLVNYDLNEGKRATDKMLVHLSLFY